MSAQIGAETGWFWRWPAMINIWGAGLWVWLQSKILLWEIYNLLLSLPFFSLPLVFPGPTWVLKIFRSSIDFCPLIVFVLTTQLELSGLWHWTHWSFQGLILTREEEHTQFLTAHIQTREPERKQICRTPGRASVWVVTVYLSHSSPMEEPRWLMGTEAVLGAVTVRSNDQRCINLFSLPPTQIATIMKTRTKCSEMFPWFIGIQPPVWLWCVTLIIVFWCSNHWLLWGG